MLLVRICRNSSFEAPARKAQRKPPRRVRGYAPVNGKLAAAMSANTVRRRTIRLVAERSWKPICFITNTPCSDSNAPEALSDNDGARGGRCR